MRSGFNLLATRVQTTLEEDLYLSAELFAPTAEIKHPKLVLVKVKCMQFGRRSEKLDQQIEQLKLQLEDLEA